MSTVIQFPRGGSDARLGPHGAAASILADPAPHDHAVQFYERDEFLCDTVGEFLAAGLRAGDRLVVIATPEHRAAFALRLAACGGDEALASGRLVVLDARETLAKFMVGAAPDADLFREALSRVLVPSTGDAPQAKVRAYGEMVDLLWREGNARAAIRLEELWNDAGREHGFALLCAYAMGNFYREGDAAQFLEVCRSHNHVLPTEAFAPHDDAGARLREIALLQQRARALEGEIEQRKALEAALRDALRERARAEDELRASLQREREARERAEASDAFKEVCLGILGHDLRNPLNTVLTTARLMTLRRTLTPDDADRVARIVSSGARMQRMVDQLLDLARARLGGGIPVHRAAQDVAPLVAKIVDELRVAHPGRVIELEAEAGCRASVDGDRFEQVVSNLVGNAVAHGAQDRPVRVALATRGGAVSLRVHNEGTPIEPALFSTLFDPFKRAEKPRGRADGLGLGLSITKQIVSAHDGRIEVASSAEAGTTFEVILPLHA